MGHRHKQNAMLGLDIGSTKLCAAICEVNADREVQISGVGTSVSAGIENGIITQPNELKQSMSRAIQRAEQSAGFLPSVAIGTILPYKMRFIHNSGLVKSKNENGQISLSDRNEAISRSRNLVKKKSENLLHLIPTAFTVDNQKVNRPEDTFGSTLEVHSHLILVHSSMYHSTTNMIKSLDFQCPGIIYDNLATAAVLLSEREYGKGVFLLDIGGNYSKLGFYQEHRLIFSTVLPLGGETITTDIAYCLEVSIPEAERLKIIYGSMDESSFDTEQIIEMTTQDNKRKELKLGLLFQIISARFKEIVDLLQKQCGPYAFSDFPIVLAGGTSLLKGVAVFMEKEWSCRVKEGFPQSIEKMIDSIGFSSAIGSVIYAIKHNLAPQIIPKHMTTFQKVKHWFKPS